MQKEKKLKLKNFMKFQQFKKFTSEQKFNFQVFIHHLSIKLAIAMMNNRKMISKN